MTLTLTRREALADGVVRLTLARADGLPVPAWTPGAHIDLLLGPGLERQYSLCGDPDDTSALQVAVLRETAGRGGSQYVHDRLTEGATVRARGPRNHFALVGAEHYLFIAGGIGITPLLPMIAEAGRRGAGWHLVYGGRTRASMAFAGELRARWPEHVEICPQDETGLLDLDGLLGVARDGTAVYCCGPEPLLAAVEERCASWPPSALHMERFAPRAGGDAVPEEPFEVELAQSGMTLTVPADRSVLEAVEDAGVPVLSSCREGTCGTCETGVLEGVPDHRDSLLTSEERAVGDVMFICVSRCRSGRLVLDL
ncbi:PDR/VanB family oxidoreductase [Streptomyces sp. NRRL F-5126]|uniref:PDR/VanB family oxidoreductase n=1 Tax=Streptomyces sp. NRRL F-5126 TaxID=1463857 RepID=UPI0004CB4592|nr:PDR/VanB family oxidoreductase [Streptomyces sp. NRRL F-5126]